MGGHQNACVIPIQLTLEIRARDGGCTEFFQSDGEGIRETWRLLSASRLFAQPKLIMTSTHGVCVIPCHAIDMILARTSVVGPSVLPLNSAAGQLYVCETRAPLPNPDSAGADRGGAGVGRYSAVERRISHVEIQTLGGWVSTLKVLAMVQGTAIDQRQTIAHLLELPVIPFRLAAGGIGFINPVNIARARACPTPAGLPDTALPMELVRWNRVFQSKGDRMSALRPDHENEIWDSHATDKIQ